MPVACATAAETVPHESAGDCGLFARQFAFEPYAGHFRVPSHDSCGERIPSPEAGSARAILVRIWFCEAVAAAREAGRLNPCFAGFETLADGELE